MNDDCLYDPLELFSSINNDPINRECTALYASPRSEQLFDDAQSLLPPITGSEDRQTLESILAKFRADMMTQLTALRDSN